MGALCDSHAQDLATCTDITAEQLIARPVDDSRGWLIDQWGATHPLGETTSIGRDPVGCEVAILHASVSTMHAQIEASASIPPRINDRGSLNGTFVNNEKIGRARLFDGDLVRFGDVSFFFTLSKLPLVDAERGSGRTVPTKGSDFLFSAVVQVADDELHLAETTEGGIGVTGEHEVTFARLEFDLLKTLAQRRLSPGATSAAYLSAKELVSTLDFQSQLADSDNVRELVRRVRRKLKTAGLTDVIQSRQGAGYRLGWPARDSR